MMSGLYGEGGIPAPGSGTGRPCYIAHGDSWPERECDGLHGREAIARFYEAEAIMALDATRSEIIPTMEQPMQTRRENDATAKTPAKIIGRFAGYLIGGIIALALVALVVAGAWWAVTTVWGAVL